MNAAELLSDLDDLGVRLEVQGDRLRVDAPRGVLTPELRHHLATYKAAVMQALVACRCDPLPHWTDPMGAAGCNPNKWEPCAICGYVWRCKQCGGCRRCRVEAVLP